MSSSATSVTFFVHLPVVVACAVAAAAAWPDLLRLVRRAGLVGVRPAWGALLILVGGAVALIPRVPSLTPLPVAVALALYLVGAVVPALALAADPLGPAEDSHDEQRVRLVVVAFLLLIAAEAFERSLGVSRNLTLQAVDQVGEARLVQFRPDVRAPSASTLVLAQFFAVFPLFLASLRMFVEGGVLWMPLGTMQILMELLQIPAAVAFRAAARSTAVPAGVLLALGLGVALHPGVVDKGSWDFIPPGTLVFVLAFVAEARGSRAWLIVMLGLGALCHPAQAVMSALWAADHARRNWPSHEASSGSGGGRLRAMAVPLVVWAIAGIPVIALVLGHFLPGGQALTARLASHGRDAVAEVVAQGRLLDLGAMVGLNLVRGALLLVSLGFLPVLRWSRFLAYAAFEIAYSLGTSNGFFHGSLPGLVGLLGCAALDNAPRVSRRTLRWAGMIAAVTFLPLTLWWSGRHFAVQLLVNPAEDRVSTLSALIEPGDRDRTCVGQASTYAFLAGQCRTESPLRFADGVPSTLARTADVYLLDLEPQPWPPRSRGLRELLENASDSLARGDGTSGRFLDFDHEPGLDDLAWIRDDLRSGALAVAAWDGRYARLERGTHRAAAPGGTPQVLATVDGLIRRRQNP